MDWQLSVCSCHSFGLINFLAKMTVLMSYRYCFSFPLVVSFLVCRLVGSSTRLLPINHVSTNTHALIDVITITIRYNCSIHLQMFDTIVNSTDCKIVVCYISGTAIGSISTNVFTQRNLCDDISKNGKLWFWMMMIIMMIINHDDNYDDLDWKLLMRFQHQCCTWIFSLLIVWSTGSSFQYCLSTMDSTTRWHYNWWQ